MDNHIFRNAALGFNRQDVMEYIEKVQKDAEARNAELAVQLEAARQEGDASRQALEDCAQERDQLSEELEELRERYEAELAEWKERYESEKSAHEAVQSELEQQKDRARSSEREAERLTDRVQELEGQMESLRREKERLTQLELDARNRSDELLAQTQVQADEIIAKATAKGKDIRSRSQSHADTMLARTRKQIKISLLRCEELLRSCESVAGRVSGELRKMDEAILQLPEEMVDLKQSIEELLEPAKKEKAHENQDAAKNADGEQVGN